MALWLERGLLRIWYREDLDLQVPAALHGHSSAPAGAKEYSTVLSAARAHVMFLRALCWARLSGACGTRHHADDTEADGIAP